MLLACHLIVNFLGGLLDEGVGEFMCQAVTLASIHHFKEFIVSDIEL